MSNSKFNLIILNLFRGFLPSLINFSIAIFGIQQFTAESWGALVSVWIILSVFSFVANWGNKEYLIRDYSKNPSLILSFYFSSLLTRSFLLLSTLILFAFYPFKIALGCILLVIAQFLYNSLNSLITYHQKFKQHLIVEIMGFLMIVTAIFYWDTFSVGYFLMLYVFVTLLKFFLMAVSLQLYSAKLDLNIDKKHLIAASPFFLIALSGWLQSRVDLYIVDYYLTSKDLSQYQVLITAFIMLQSVSALIVNPFSKHIYRADYKLINNMSLLLSAIGLVVVVIGGGTIWIFIENFTIIHFESEVYLIMTIASFPTFLFMIDIFKHYKQGKEKRVMQVNFLGAIANLMVTVYLIQFSGILGAVIGICFAQWLMLAAYKFRKND